MCKFGAVVLSALLLAGCFQRPVVDEGDEAKTKTKTEEAVAKKTPSGPKPVQRDSMAGTWVLQTNQQITQQGHFGWLPLCLLKISKSDSGKYRAELLPSPHSKDWRIEKSDIDEKSAHLVLSRDQNQLDIQVSLQATEAPGNVLAAPSELRPPVPARLLATTETHLHAFLPPVPHEHFQDFEQAMNRLAQQKDPEAVEAFIKQHPRNPISYFAIIYISSPILKIRAADDPRPDSKDVRPQLKRLESLSAVWGRRAALLAKIELAGNLVLWRSPGTRLVRKNINLDIAWEIVAGAESPESQRLLTEDQQARLADLKTYIELERNAVALLATQDPKRRSAAMTYLDDFLQTAPQYVPWLLYAQAEGNRLAGNVDKAVEQYARLLAMPAATQDLEREFEARWMKTPDLRKQLEALWTKTGNKAGVDDYLAQAYRRAMNDLVPDLVATRPAAHRKRTHLCELFTSCDEPFCVGADVASQVVQRTHKPVDVVVLRYHLDAPDPNPLVCNDAKLRAFDCQIPGAPMILVNGKPLAPRMASTLAGVPALQALVRNAVRSDSADETPRYQVRVSASARGKVLTIKAEVDGPQQADPDVRLRLVLAEDRISYTGKNGIRHHDMVVRSMPAGIDGVVPKAGKTTLTKTVDLSDLSSRLRDFLTSLEEKTNVKLSVKPVDFKKLHVVAFVQRTNRRREVLQVAKTVVDGLGAPEGKTSKQAAPAKTGAKSP